MMTLFKQELQMLMRSTVFDDKILSFKTIGNAGLWEMIPTIRTYIQDKSQPQMLRTQAIYSLRKLARHYPDDVSEIYIYLKLKNTKFSSNITASNTIFRMN